MSLEFSGPQGLYHWIVIGNEQWFRNGPSADAWRPWSKRPGPPHVMNADLIRFVVGGDLHDVITDALSAPTIQAQGREPCAAGECLVLNYVNRTPSYVVTFWVDPATKLIVKAIVPVGTWEWLDYGVPNDLKPPI